MRKFGYLHSLLKGELMNAFDLVVRISYKDVHYGGGVIAGARLLELFGDAVTGLSALNDSDESLLSGWKEVEFKEKVKPGDFIKISARLIQKKKMRRTIEVKAYRIINCLNNETGDLLPGDELKAVASAIGTVVIPFSKAKGG